jgi:phospholipase C
MSRGLDKIDHCAFIITDQRVFIIAENRSFDNAVGCFPGADGAVHVVPVEATPIAA